MYRKVLPALVAVAVWLAMPAVDRAADLAVIPAGSSDEIQRWIDALKSDRFEARQQASRRLLAIGHEAIESLQRVAGSSDAEVTRRSIDLLRQFLLSEDFIAGRDAQEALSSLTQSANRSTAYRAAAALRSRHEVALLRIKSLGGTVDESSGGKGEYYGPRVYLQKGWRGGDDGLRHLRNLDRFEYLSLRDAAISGEGLRPVAEFAQLKWLSLRGTDVNDETIAALRRQPTLQWLSLEETDVTDEGLRHLAGLTNLKNLYIGEAAVVGPGLAHVKSLYQLRYLSLKALDITDDSLKYVSELTELEHLGLDDTPVTDTALVHLRNMTRLQTLWLTRSRVTDEGLAHLTHLTALTRLYLDGTDVTDAGLVHLEGLTELRNVQLSQTKVTNAGVEALKQALPHVHVER